MRWRIDVVEVEEGTDVANASGLLVIERILRDRQSIWQQVVEDRSLTRLTSQMLLSSGVALACYGAVLGSFHGVQMALTSAVKLPLLFLVTLAICLPTLYLFNLVFGARLSIRQSLALVMVALTVTAMLAMAFAPIALFFLITAPDYGFFKLLNVAILALSALVGLRFLTGGMRVLNENGLLAPLKPAVQQQAPAAAPATPALASTAAPTAASTAAPDAVPANGSGGTATITAPAPAPAPAYTPPVVPPGYMLTPIANPHQRPVLPPRQSQPTPPSMTLLYVWILLFGFVGTQLAWTLRPFFGSPGMKFSLYRDIDGNFYAEIFRTLSNLF
ncbi:hypothetical protein [Actinoplanes sp. ATCC 53533]|uniref:hypothetical protein n=1 Tax=Actinoplanes sp. ATCC 53533 TaxID=1288362 RepID=UPI001F2E9851|nr:hypothetical protein [Actinoplanes sp. ATCC 53533]